MLKNYYDSRTSKIIKPNCYILPLIVKDNAIISINSHDIYHKPFFRMLPPLLISSFFN